MREEAEFWREQARPGPTSVVVRGVELRKGSLVRLEPKAGGDILDLALAGQVAVVEGIDEDDRGKLHLSVTVRDDPGRALGEARFLGHRFFYGLDEVQPLDGEAAATPAATKRVLVAGIGNVFLGDDGFGVEVAQRLLRGPRAPGVEVADFGIRGMDLALELQKGYDAVVLVDAMQHGRPPGTLSVLEPDLSEFPERVAIETHAMDPVRVLGLARALGRVPPRALVVGCEPELVVLGDDCEAMRMELSECVRGAVERAAALVESLVAELSAPDGDAAEP